jgi:hypothetical protein
MKASRRPRGVLAAALLSAAMVFAVAGPASASGGGGGIHDAPGYVHLQNVRSGECIDPETESVEPFVILAQQTCRNAKSQEWAVAVIESTGGVYYLINNHNSNLCAAPVDPAGANGSKVDQITCAIDPIQEWAQVVASGETFLKNRLTGKCLDLENGDPTIGVEMQVWDCNFSTANQEWNFL